MFLEGAGANHEAAWDMYHRFRAHQERKAHKERIYQAMLEELGGNEPLARDVHALWREQEGQQTENPEEGQEERDENELDVLTRATMWAKAFREGYELRESSLQKSPAKIASSTAHEDNSQSTEPTEEPDVYDCLGEWAIRLDGQQQKESGHSLEEGTKMTTSNRPEGNNALIDVEQNQAVYDCLDEWAMSLESSTKHASVFDKIRTLWARRTPAR